MRLGVYGKVTGLFMTVTLLMGWVLGLGCLGVVGQLESAITETTTPPSVQIWQQARGMLLLYTLLSTSAVLLAGVLVLRHWLQRPMRCMVAGVDRILGQGDFNHRIQIQQPEDFSHLAQAINHMADDLRSLASETGTRPGRDGSLEEGQDHEERQTRTAGRR